MNETEEDQSSKREDKIPSVEERLAELEAGMLMVQQVLINHTTFLSKVSDGLALAKEKKTSSIIKANSLIT